LFSSSNKPPIFKIYKRCLQKFIFVPEILEVVSKRQIAFESKAQADEKAQSAIHSGG